MTPLVRVILDDDADATCYSIRLVVLAREPIGRAPQWIWLAECQLDLAESPLLSMALGIDELH